MVTTPPPGASQQPTQPEQVGPYRILAHLGQGGMGAVYLAEREGLDFTQRVALKLLSGDGVDPLLAAQLKKERRILARLEHPNIARFIDGGTTRDGRSYIAMEYVEGATLLEYCEQQGIDVEARVRLFLEVCGAVQYAHQQLVVHRDLKPRNILVTAEGRVKLLDFGIAKLTEPSGGGRFSRADHTQTGNWLTPAYASPEQVRGEPVTTSTDVYACGILLYEALTGVRPYEVDGLAPAEVQRIVCEYVPDRPSGRVRDGQLRRELSGDLDVIVLKALAKEPERRYASMQELGDDLGRYLDRRPVLARPDSAAYRASRFIRRHRAAVVAAVIALALLIGGIVTTSWLAATASRERDRAEAARRQSEEAADFLIGLFQTNDPTEGLEDSVTAADMFSRGIERAEALKDRPLVQAQMFDALGQVAINLSRYEMALDLLTQAVELRRAAYPDGHPDLAVSLRHQAAAAARLGDYARNEQLIAEALAMDRRWLGDDHPVTLSSIELMARSAVARGRYREAEALQQEALDRRKAAQGENHPATILSFRALAVWRMRRGFYEEAEQMYREVIRQQTETLGPDANELLITKLRLGDMLASRMGRFEEAEQLFRDVLQTQTRQYGENDRRIYWAMHSLGDVLDTLGRYDEADELFEHLLDLNTRAMGPDHASTIGTMEINGAHQRRAGRYRESLATFHRALAMKRALLGPSNIGVAGTMFQEGWTQMELGNYAAADSIFREANAIIERYWTPYVTRQSDGHRALAINAIRWGRYEYAQSHLEQARAIIDPLLASGEVTPDFLPAFRLREAAILLDEAWADPDAVERH